MADHYTINSRGQFRRVSDEVRAKRPMRLKLHQAADRRARHRDYITYRGGKPYKAKQPTPLRDTAIPVFWFVVALFVYGWLILSNI